jgi:hypothetical protein
MVAAAAIDLEEEAVIHCVQSLTSQEVSIAG